MYNLKFLLPLIIIFFILTSCSVVTKLKEKLSSKKELLTDKESTKDSYSQDDMNFYNKYIEVMNKIQDAGEDVYRDYNSSIPEPSSITKNSLIIPVGLSISVQTLERTVKEYKRSFYDNGPLSKLHASGEIQNEIETDFKGLMTAMEEFSPVAQKVSDYYSKYEYQKDLSHTKEYDEEMKNAYNKFKSAFDRFSTVLRKNKPRREVRDPNSISNPDERASVIMLNAYSNILDGAEGFFESFNGAQYDSDLSSAKSKLDQFEKIFNDNKTDVLNAEYTDRTRFMKYNFEDYFAPTANKFIEAGKKLFEGSGAKNETDFKKHYNDVVNTYNSMISSYNTSINTLNMLKW